MTTTVTSTIRNGVDSATMYATLDAIKAQPELAKFQFRARNTWLGGAHNRTSIKDFYAAGGEDTTRSESFILDAGEPPILLGHNEGPNPVEYFLTALAACVTTSMVYVATARKVNLTSVRLFLLPPYRCHPAPPRRARWPGSWPSSARASPPRHSKRSSGWLSV